MKRIHAVESPELRAESPIIRRKAENPTSSSSSPFSDILEREFRAISHSCSFVSIRRSIESFRIIRIKELEELGNKMTKAKEKKKIICVHAREFGVSTF